MSLVKWESFNELGQCFDDRISQPFRFGFDLAVDIYEIDGNVVAKMTLSGMHKEALDILIADDVLTISGRRDEECEIGPVNYFSKEIRRGSFSRTVSLPRSVVATKSRAKYENGELTIAMPVVAGARQKMVKVNVM